MTSGRETAAYLPGPPLTERDAEWRAHGICFKTGPPSQIGVELEWLVIDGRDPALPVDQQRVAAALDRLEAPLALPGGGRLTTEPGGQVELSSAPAPSLGGCVSATEDDLAALRGALRPAGLFLAGQGIDPIRAPRRVLDAPRYVAMEAVLRPRRSLGPDDDVQHRLGSGLRQRWPGGPRPSGFPLALAPPARDRPGAGGRVRQLAAPGGPPDRMEVHPPGHLGRLDPSRTRAPAGADRAHRGRRGDGWPEHSDPRSAWVSYALDAEVMCVRQPGAPCWDAPAGLTFRDWLRGAGERPPTADDLAYHLSTLFPPVPPHGHLELRMIDAQPGDGWIVPTAVVSALVDDAVAAQAAMAVAVELWHGYWPVTRHRPAAGHRAGLPGTGRAPARRRAASPTTPGCVRPGSAPATPAGPGDPALLRRGAGQPRPPRCAAAGPGRGQRVRRALRAAGPMSR